MVWKHWWKVRKRTPIFLIKLFLSNRNTLGRAGGWIILIILLYSGLLKAIKHTLHIIVRYNLYQHYHFIDKWYWDVFVLTTVGTLKIMMKNEKAHNNVSDQIEKRLIIDGQKQFAMKHVIDLIKLIFWHMRHWGKWMQAMVSLRNQFTTPFSFCSISCDFSFLRWLAFFHCTKMFYPHKILPKTFTFTALLGAHYFQLDNPDCSLYSMKQK